VYSKRSPTGRYTRVPAALPPARVNRSSASVSRPSVITNAPESPAARAAQGSAADSTSAHGTSQRRSGIPDLPRVTRVASAAPGRALARDFLRRASRGTRRHALPALQRLAAPPHRATGRWPVRPARAGRIRVRGLPRPLRPVLVAGPAPRPHRLRGLAVPVLLGLRGQSAARLA